MSDSDIPQAIPRPIVAKRQPHLPFRDEKLVPRPLGGHRLDLWPRTTLAATLSAAATVSLNERRNLNLRTSLEQNLGVISTPSSHATDALLKVQEQSLG
ncbi:hypothetical protein MRX96_019972 [Rhipicephalus microplus]